MIAALGWAGSIALGQAAPPDGGVPLYTNADLAKLGAPPASPSVPPGWVEATDWSGLQTFLDHEYGRIAAERAYEQGRRDRDADRERETGNGSWSLPGYYPGYYGGYYGYWPHGADRQTESSLGPRFHTGGHGRYSFTRGEDAFPGAQHSQPRTGLHRGSERNRRR